MRFVLLFIAQVILAASNGCRADSDVVAIVDQIPQDSNSLNLKADAPRSLLRSLASCPTGSAYKYLSRNSSCVINYLCVRGREPFKISGCGCGCHTVNIANSSAVCPSGAGVGYSSYKYPCVINYLCVKGRESFSIPGCGCGCRPVPPTPTAPTTAPVAVSKKPTISNSSVVCPSGPDYSYFTHKYPCVINFLCVRGKEGFSIPGCGCGCKTVTPTPPVVAPTRKPVVATKKPTTSNSTVVCPSSPAYGYVTHKYPCFINFLCIRGTEPFSIKDCGCGCKTIAPIPAPVKPIVKPTFKPTAKPVKPTNSTTKCPSGSGVVYVNRNYPCVINFLCTSNKPVAFSVPGCGCGCRTKT